MRDGVELTGGGVTSINAELRVGAVAESITVTGETPVVDVQSARQQTVLSGDVVRALPASRGYGNYLAAIPAIQATGFNNGVATNTNFFTARGGRANEGVVQIDGLNVGSPFNGGGVSNYAYDMNNCDRSPGLDLRRPGRGRPRRAYFQHHPQDGRQQLSAGTPSEAGPASGASLPTSTQNCGRWDSPTRRRC